MLTLSLITLIASLMMMMLTHPLSLGSVLLTSTITVSLMVGYFNYNFWYSYLLFIIMIGGMLVLFAYMTSVAANEKFTISIKMVLAFLPILPLMFILFTLDLYFSNLNNVNEESINHIMMFKLSLTKFINYPSNMIMFFLIIYLLITLIAVVKITNINKGPLRQMN
uniref:NADH-ubiquinone oxidoreductase chain 6 n=1 Tax=Serica sp. NS-2020 TaxID=2794600 RepID=A0A7T1M836_9SCAR|nr:NADH dehydrogenase subunit 6 [Serica sp. NS-2020]